jgi:predicted metal-dependent phosphoesterase TrpH
MDLVTVTDHDSLDAAELLSRYPDFFASEEVTCETPNGTEIHVGVYDLNERQHVEVQRRRRDLPALAAYLNEQNLFFSINHAFSALTGRRLASDFDLFAELFPAWETRNGHMPERSNRYAERMARRFGKVELGGSDAHSLASSGSAWTEVSGAKTKQEFLAGLRAGQATTGGEHGSFIKLTLDVLTIAAGLMREHPWTVTLLPLAAAVPLVTASNKVTEILFARHWYRRLTTPAGLPDGLADLAR